MKLKKKIPEEVISLSAILFKHGFRAYVVGGCVRDLLLGREPNDWDIATDADPIAVQTLFPENVYENAYGTVLVKTNSRDPRLEIVEVTTFRTEHKYSDRRHPDAVRFSKSIEEDLGRRDFTINAMALDITPMASEDILVDPYGGQEDLKNKLVRAVRNPDERFQEDALRLIKAVRMVAQLGFTLEKETGDSVLRNAHLLKEIAQERIRDEFMKIIMSNHAAIGMIFLQRFGLLSFIIPELENGIGVIQNRHHTFDVWEHSVRSLDYTCQKGYSLEVRLAALFHDIDKPKTKQGNGWYATFHGHEIEGERTVMRILRRMRFPEETVIRVAHLVRYHMFYYNVGEVTDAGVRRFIARVGEKYIDDLIRLREADRIGSGVPKAQPYRLRHLLFMIDKVRRDPISPKTLTVNGNELMERLEMVQGPRVGWILAILLDEVLEHPEINKKDLLIKRAEELNLLDDETLETLVESAKARVMEFEVGAQEKLKKLHGV